MTRRIPPLIVLLTIVSCSQPVTLTESNKAIIAEDVRHMLDTYYRDIKKSGLTGEFKYLDNSTDFFWVPPGYSSSISYDSVLTILRQNAPKYKSIDNSFDTLRIIPLSKELAAYTGRLTSSMTDTSNVITTFKLVETGTLIKRKDGWKLLNGQTSLLNE
jgi:hypothetical protein